MIYNYEYTSDKYCTNPFGCCLLKDVLFVNVSKASKKRWKILQDRASFLIIPCICECCFVVEVFISGKL